MKIKCFFIQPTNKYSQGLRRYSSNSPKCGTGEYSYHNAITPIENGEGEHSPGDLHDHNDLRWPRKCEICDYYFQTSDEWQLFCDTIYQRTDTGEEMTLRSAPPGAMWYATWLEDHKRWCGPDGHCLVVKTPGGEWMIDSVASNCTKPNDVEHHCWIRHGTVPDIHVDKNGNTCSAGAGSIQCGQYHGYLRHGYLED